MLIRRIAGLLAAAAASTVLLLSLTAAPAAAHVELKADKNQAGATDVTLSFDAENESSKASIVSVRIALPPGIAAADVTLASAPTGWTLAPADDGFTLGGTPLGTKKNAAYAIKVARLPLEVKTLAFKTLVTYSDGKVDRWIGDPGSDNPAPVLTLGAPAAAPSPSLVEPTSAPAVVPTTPAGVPTTPAGVPTTLQPTPLPKDGGSGTVVWIIVGVVAVAAGVGIVLWRRRA